MKAQNRLLVSVMALALPALAVAQTEHKVASASRPESVGQWVMLQPTVAISRTITARPNNLTEGVVEAMAIHVVKPVYPQSAQDAHLGGLVQVRATIQKSGRIAKAHAVSGPPVLRVAAEDALKQWRYEPTLLNGHAVDTKAVVEFRFGLND